MIVTIVMPLPLRSGSPGSRKAANKKAASVLGRLGLVLSMDMTGQGRVSVPTTSYRCCSSKSSWAELLAWQDIPRKHKNIVL
ncbi:hypothetical protein JZX87_17265 [Agrobacterium sp. Ap1]|jgi:hypothetical protein|uniref:hypothetical protein n=1 Tax=Agrobacterium sp. Ap1 TaxID=2815337 RepID=UPI001A908AB9|nr:hypothetical protein [Agrobacterium sp. Ap1]MBO0142922.1 hypothetical protein [Agrobacterium sp. Ap1]